MMIKRGRRTRTYSAVVCAAGVRMRAFTLVLFLFFVFIIIIILLFDAHCALINITQYVARCILPMLAIFKLLPVVISLSFRHSSVNSIGKIRISDFPRENIELDTEITQFKQHCESATNTLSPKRRNRCDWNGGLSS